MSITKARPLTSHEALVLEALTCRGDRHVTHLAKLVGLKVHQFRYAQERLAQKGLLRPTWVVDTFKIGLKRFSLHFSLMPHHSRSKDLLIKAAMAHPKVLFFQENGGTHDYELHALCEDEREFLQILGNICTQSSLAFATKTVCSQLEVVQFSHKYLSNGRLPTASLGISSHEAAGEVSHDDLDFLKALSRAPQLSIRELARAMKKPESTISQRFLRLKQLGVIVGLTMRTFPEHFGYQVYKLEISSKTLDAGLSSSLRKFANQHPMCTYFIHCVGPWDFEIGFLSSSRSQALEVRDEISATFAKHLQSVTLVTRLRNHRNVSL